LGGIFETMGLSSPVDTQALDSRATALYLSQQKYNDALKDQAAIEREIADSRRQIAARPAAAGAPVSASGLRASAQSDAIDAGTSAIRAAGIRRRQALVELDRSMGVVNGKVPGANAQAYREK